MASEPENITLKQLAVLRAEMQEGFAKLTAEQAVTSEKIGVRSPRAWFRCASRSKT
jgi:hypothetical protein